ncbi:MAG: hypothetical protein Q4A98_07725 [Comamonadaceae bacterium]|nr:hypothetical protein [Comamonadaceae bacterium]
MPTIHDCGRHKLPPVCLGALFALTALMPFAAQAACVETTESLTADGGDVCTTSHDAYTYNLSQRALFADGSGSVITVPSAVTISQGANWLNGNFGAVAVGNGGAVNFQGPLTLIQNGRANSYGLAATDRAGGGGSINAQNVHITMANGGRWRRAVVALGTGGEVDIIGKATIVATGGSEHRGLSAEEGGRITYATADIDFTGWPGSAALRSINGTPSDPTRIFATGESVLKVSGIGSAAALLSSGYIDLQAIDITAADGADAVTLAGEDSLFRAEGGTVSVSGGGDAFSYRAVTNESRAILKNVNVTVTGGGALWNSSTPGADFVAGGGVYTGRSQVQAGGALRVALVGDALWNMNSDSSLTSLEMGGTAKTRITDSHTLTTSAGVHSQGDSALELDDGVADDTLIVDGNYMGSGFLRLDTDLGTGAGGADVLHIKGNYDYGGLPMETTRIQMNLTGAAAGAATTGNGILVVQVDGNSPAGAFVLDGTVWHGGYLYELKQVGKNWYLQSRAAPNPAASSSSATPVPALPGAGLALLGAGLALSAALTRRRRRGG